MTSSHRSRLLISLGTPLAATAGLLLAACGGGSHATANGRPHGSTNQQALVVLRQLAGCVRAHGLPSFPDPVVRDNGVPVFPDSAPRVPQAAQQACRGIAARIPPSYTATTPVSSSDYQKLLALARCVRAHGVPDWPDPNALGQFPIDARLQHGGKRAFGTQLSACARLNPDPSGGIDVIQARP